MTKARIKALEAKVAEAAAIHGTTPGHHFVDELARAFVLGVKWAAANLDERELGAMAVAE